jgi:hypothetical protein
VLPLPLGSNREGTAVVRPRGRWAKKEEVVEAADLARPRHPTPLTRSSRTPRSGGSAVTRKASTSPLQVERGERREGAEDQGQRLVAERLAHDPPPTPVDPAVPKGAATSRADGSKFYDGFGLPELEPPEPMTPGTSSDVAATPRRDKGKPQWAWRGTRTAGRATATMGQVRRGGRRPAGRGGTEAAGGGTDGEGGGRERGKPGKTRGRWRRKMKKKCESDTWVSHV